MERQTRVEGESEMDGDSDGNRSKRSRVRENMEGVGLFRDRVQNV